MALGRASESPRIVEVLPADVVMRSTHDRWIVREFVRTLDRSDDREPFQDRRRVALDRKLATTSAALLGSGTGALAARLMRMP